MKTQLKGKTILITDDEADIRELIRSEMEAAGAKVLEAENGTVALETVRRNQVDLLIADIRMPGGNGIELLTALFESKAQGATVPALVVVTGFSDLSEDRAKELGVHALISKPFSLAPLVPIAHDAIKAKA